MSAFAVALAIALTASADKAGYVLNIDGRGVYRKVLFLGLAVDVKAKLGEPDRFISALAGLESVLRDNCSQSNDQVLTGTAATPQALTAALEGLSRSATPADRVIVDIVCHGDLSAGGKFLLSDGKTGSLPIEMTKVRELFLKIPAGHKLLIVDGCKSGTILTGGGRFDGSADALATIGRACPVIWASAQAGADATSELGGTTFHFKLAEAIRANTVYGKPLLLSTVVETVKRQTAPISSFEGPDTDVILAGTDSKSPPLFDPNQGRQEPTPTDAAAAEAALKKQEKGYTQSVSEEQAHRLLAILETKQHLTTKRVAETLADSLKQGEVALAFFTPADHPKEHIQTRNALGYLSETVGVWKPDAALLRMAAAHRLSAVSLREQDPGHDADALADARFKAAAVFQNLGEAGDPVAARRSVQLYDQVSAVWTRSVHPGDWATIQNNVAISLAGLGERGDVPALSEAVTRFRLALEVYARPSAPTKWAAIQSNLATALLTLGRMGDERALQESIQRFTAALEVRTRDAAPADWATTQGNLANAKGVGTSTTKFKGQVPHHAYINIHYGPGLALTQFTIVSCVTLM